MRSLFSSTVKFFALISISSALVSPSFAEKTSPWPGGKWSPASASYGATLQRNVSIKMSDGVILKADISYPTDLRTGERAAGKFPVLLTQQPYVSANPKFGDYFVKHGYIYVTAYVRGTTKSGGDFLFFSDRDAQDGVELVNWASQELPGSSGILGLHGNSYMALTQFFTAANLVNGSPVKAMSASCMGAEFYRETYFSGGIPTQTLNFQKVAGKSMGSTSSGDAGLANYAEISAGGEKAYDREFWKKRTVGNLVPKVVAANIPILLWSSNEDIYAQSSMELYSYLQNAYGKQPVYGKMPDNLRPSGRYQIVINQGTHCMNQNQRIHLAWFETWLKGIKTNMANTNMPIHVHEMGSDRWLNTSHYPTNANYTRFYLDVAGKLSTEVPASTGLENLAWAQPSPSSTVQYETPVFPAGATIAGAISASIQASSTTNNLQLIATLKQVSKDGTEINLTSGAVLGSMSELDSDRSWYDSNGVPVRPYGKYDMDRNIPAGTIKNYDFVISPRYVQMEPGSKLRVVFTTQTPTEKCTPVLGTDPCFPTATQTASLNGSVVTIHHGPSNKSSINLPLLKTQCWRSGDNPGIPYWEKHLKADNNSAPCQY